MKILRSISLILLSSSICTALPASEETSWYRWLRQTSLYNWLNTSASQLSLVVYNSPKLDKSVTILRDFLETASDALGGERIENRPDGECAPIVIVFVRGTSEARNVGTIVGPPVFKTLREAIAPKKVFVQGVKWEGLLSTYQLGGDPEGIDDMVEKVNLAVKECVEGKGEEASKIVMAGFSQGALMTRAAITKLSVDVMKHVSAIVLWGDPARRDNKDVEQPILLNDTTSIPGIGDKVHVVCHPMDPFCQNYDVTTPFHYVYFQWGKEDAVKFILQKTSPLPKGSKR